MELEELNNALEGIGGSFDKFKSANADQMKGLEDRFQEMEDTIDDMVEKGLKLPGHHQRETEQKTAVENFLRKGVKEGLETKDMETGVGADGGYTVIPSLDRTIVDTLAETNPILADADRQVIDSNEYQRLYTVSGAVSGRVAEKATRDETAAPQYARPTIDLTMQYAYPKATEELVLSSSFDIAAHVSREIATAFDADWEAEMISGDGVAPNQKGFITAADSYDDDASRAFGSYQLVKSGTSGDFGYDNLVELIYSLAPKYRRGAKLYASTSAIETMRKLKDTNDMPIWRDADTTVTRPQGVLGYEVVEAPQMAAVGAGSKSLAFGNMMQAYAFVSNASGLQILRDPYTEPGYIKFYTRLLCGSGPMDTRALKVMELAA